MGKKHPVKKYGPRNERNKRNKMFSKDSDSDIVSVMYDIKLYHGIIFQFLVDLKSNKDLIWVGGNFTPCWFSLNNSEAVKAAILAFCRDIRDIRAEFGIPNSPQSPNIVQNSDGGISDFRISGQSFIKENCHNFRTSNDIGTKLGPVTKLDKRNTAMLKEFTMASCR